MSEKSGSTPANGSAPRRGSATRHIQRIFFWLNVLLCVASACFLGTAIRSHLAYKNETFDLQLERLKEKTQDGAQKIGNILKDATEATESIAGRLSSGALNRETMAGALMAALEKNVHVHGGTITFRPYGFDPDKEFHYFYFARTGPDNTLQADSIDYNYVTDERYDWYSKPMAEGNRWGEPFWDDAGKTYMTTYSAVFDLADPVTGTKGKGGVVTMDISMDEIRRVIKGLDFGSFGFGGLTTSAGTYLYHPKDEYVTGHKNLRDIARDNNDPDRLIMAEAALNGESGVLDHVSTTTGQQSWLIYKPVPISGWSLQNTFIKDYFVDARLVRRQWMLIACAATFLLLAFGMLSLRIEKGGKRDLWLMSGISTFLFTANISFTWGLALTYSWTEETEGDRISDISALEFHIDSHNQRCEERKRNLPLYIPTGIQIETIGLENPNDLTFSGSVWQRYTDASAAPDKSSPPPFQFAGALSSAISELSRKDSQGEIVILWKFRAVIRQRLDASEYPLDQERLAIRLLPLERDGGTALIPDLRGYKLLLPSSLPGIHEDAFLSGWKLREAYFELKKQDSPANLGLERSVDEVHFPSLSYDLVIRRDFVDSFLSNLTPLILVAVMLFAILLLAGKIDYGRAFSICVGMLFVIVLSHIRIRDRISSDHIFYLEYFYFIIYCSVLWVAINSIREPLGLKLSFFGRDNHLIAHILYWPFLLGVLSVITFFTFYFEGS